MPNDRKEAIKNIKNIMENTNPVDITLEQIKDERLRYNVNNLIKVENKSYILMCKDKEILTFTIYNGYITSLKLINNTLKPFIINNNPRSLEYWLNSRCIDLTRINARLLKKMLNIYEDEKWRIVLSNRAFSMLDYYWIKIENEDINFNDVDIRNNNDEYNLIQMLAIGTNSELVDKLSPIINTELTDIGSLNKTWKYYDDWWLIKKMSENELYSEYTSYIVSSFLGIETPKANIITIDNQKLLASEYFIKENDMFVSYKHLNTIFSNKDMDVITTYQNLNEISEAIGFDYAKLIIFDAIVRNVDRHTENFGIIIDYSTGKVKKLAPNYDFNLTLTYDNKIHTKKDMLIDECIELVNFDNKLLVFVNEFTEKLNSNEFKKYLELNCINSEIIIMHYDIIMKRIDLILENL